MSSAPDRPSLAVARRHLDQLTAQSWHAFHPRPALYCLPGVTAVLATGLAMGEPGGAMVAASGAFSAGFGAFQRVGRRPIAPMLLGTVCMAIATALGTVASGAPWLQALLVGGGALTLAVGTAFGTGPWWVLLQGEIFLIVSGSQPGDLREGLSRAGLIVLGGVVQSLMVGVLRTLAPNGFPAVVSPTNVPPPESRSAWAAAARRVFNPASPEIRHGLLLGLATGVAVLLAARLGLPNGYWLAMTVVLVLRRGGGETVVRGVLRMAGTLLGASVATLVAAVLRPGPEVLIALIALSAWAAYAVQWVNYGAFSACVTSYIAFLFALQGLPEALVAAHRVVATLAGGVLAMAAFTAARLLRLAPPSAPV